MRILILLFGLALSACATGSTTGSTTGKMAVDRAAIPAADLPPMKYFKAGRIDLPTRSNHEIARDFMDLSFKMESGKILSFMTRFEGPISLRVTGKPPPSLFFDLDKLLKRLKNEAGINIHRAKKDAPANITIEAISQARMQRLVPNAACFVVPNIASWQQFRRLRHSATTSWINLQRREQITIFLPYDVSPQEIRDCLHEELAQALGPLNDLYRLADSVFNDDNFHTVLTGFDMLILRAYYAPEMHNGMTRAQAANALPQVLARLNPRGQLPPKTAQASPTPRSWINAIETALGARTSPANRRAAAIRAVEIAQAQGWQGPRLGFSLYALGRLSLSSKSDAALTAFLSSGIVYKSTPDTAIQTAHVAMQLSAFALAAGDAQAVLKLANDNLPAIADSQNAALLATFMLIKAQALELSGHASEARAVRLEGLGWARYGFGSDKAVLNRLAEIRALAPIRRAQHS